MSSSCVSDLHPTPYIVAQIKQIKSQILRVSHKICRINNIFADIKVVFEKLNDFINEIS